ncbi:OLC1v1036029C1 [Oldenlandia corymbosa var. corymbosa]|uniref:OLC1v1036029C1 n=1 Tax=Oldenlandia corymbosa var. corymbosa TaxID=529605 RepID=A0AAV1CUG7_OLDCO|nr:OLC1v1036029C1 [Oldenlandia corymbosa var. corymbosa]
MVDVNKPDLVAVLEPRISGLNADEFLEKRRFDRSFRVEAKGISGGICLIWNETIEVEILECHRQYIHTRIWRGSESFLTTFVYASPTQSIRRALWPELRRISEGVQEPWLLGGDLNFTLRSSEKRGGSPNNGGPCSWFMDWVMQSAWLLHQDFDVVGKEHWKPAENFVEVEGNFATGVTKWNNVSFGNIFRRKRRALARLGGIQRAKENYTSKKLERLEVEISKELDDILAQEELLLMQKSNREWVLHGDKNSKFYHSFVRRRIQRNWINATKNDEGKLVESQEELQEIATNYFNELYAAPVMAPVEYGVRDCFPPIQPTDVDNMARPVEEEEIAATLKEIHPLKAHEIDGLHALFLQKKWATVKNSVCTLI